MQLKLAKLKSLTEEEKGENGMLRSRIEEQSQLIMILKQRSDEATLRIRALEKINSDLDGRQGEFNDERRRSKKKYDILDSRFNDLALNHEEMIKIKVSRTYYSALYIIHYISSRMSIKLGMLD